MDVILSENYS